MLVRSSWYEEDLRLAVPVEVVEQHGGHVRRVNRQRCHLLARPLVEQRDAAVRLHDDDLLARVARHVRDAQGDEPGNWRLTKTCS